MNQFYNNDDDDDYWEEDNDGYTYEVLGAVKGGILRLP